MNYKEKLQEYKGQFNSYSKLLSEEEENNRKLSVDFIDAELALNIITLVGRETQEKLSFRIENLTTSALEYVVPEPYKFKVQFTIKNNRTQCELYFENYGFKASPMGDSAGTVLDTASIALRLSMWSLQPNRNAPIFILDECSKHVSADLREHFAEFLAEMCKRLSLQIIMVSHDDSVIESADNVIKIKKIGQYSEVA